MLGIKLLLALILLATCTCKGRCCTSNCNFSAHSSLQTVATTTSSPPAEGSHYMIVIVSISCAAVIFLGVLSVVILSTILTVNANKKKKEEKLSCEAIAAQKKRNISKSLEDDDGDKKKGKGKDNEWFDDMVSPPLPLRTAEMFILESPLSSSNESCSSSSTITVTVDIEESSDSSGSDVFLPKPKSVFDREPGTCNVEMSPIKKTRVAHDLPSFRVHTDKQQSCDVTPKSNRNDNSHSSTTPKSRGVHSYENTPKYSGPVTRYENVTADESATPMPPPIPPRPHSKHTHRTNHMTAPPISLHVQRAPTSKIPSSSFFIDELPEADRYNQEHPVSKCGDGDTTSEESVDMWPPPIPQQTKEMFILIQKDEEVEAVEKYSMEMTGNVAYGTVNGGGGNMYVLHKRDN